jgi:dihydroorotase
VKLLLRDLQLLPGAAASPRRGSVLLAERRIIAFDQEAEALAAVDLEVVKLKAQSQWLMAPVLVDCHSILEDPELGTAETLQSLAVEAAAAGYGSVALLPQARPWRDQPELLQLKWPEPLQLHCWGALTVAGKAKTFAPHAELLQAGAIGLAETDQIPPLALLERALVLGEALKAPLLVAPRDPLLTQAGFVREGLTALRLGWPGDPYVSETLALASLLALADASASGPSLRLMNLSTAASVDLLKKAIAPPQASVSWWHLLSHNAELDPLAEGWRVQPSLGDARDRHCLRDALRSGLLQAVAVHHCPLDFEEQLLPLDQRRPGVAGYQAVLPSLWHALVEQEGWAISDLWQALSWGPATFLGVEAESLKAGSNRWLLFDPKQPFSYQLGSKAANKPLAADALTGRIIASGLQMLQDWQLDPGLVGNRND